MIDISKAEKFVRDNNITKITTSQIRKFLSAVNRISNKVNYQNDSEELSDDIIAEIEYMRIQFAYIVGKNKTKEMTALYNDLSPIMSQIKKSKSAFINFARYVEAIIAYHKFYGGRE
ncbi:type III-A CRISPR-associated protein Csm2 [Brachyspira intermedia]|uniref:type III-A CRISPR-associated protein Csm2 n=1 Tax=Brachyspira intermedia TaxID=84377 RepID=UPI0030064F39